jgi:hypothetical protein
MMQRFWCAAFVTFFLSLDGECAGGCSGMSQPGSAGRPPRRRHFMHATAMCHVLRDALAHDLTRPAVQNRAEFKDRIRSHVSEELERFGLQVWNANVKVSNPRRGRVRSTE